VNDTVRDAGPDPDPLAQGGATAAGQWGPRVLIVEDEPMLRRALAEMLQAKNIRVAGQAREGDEAVRLASELHPDVVLMDLRMPGMDGIEATSRIKQLEPRTQVLVLSAYDDPGLHRSAEEAGVFCYLVKGCAPQLILDMIERAWGHAKLV
jgi:DNA-binding NarL/FixJ family response regulator